MDSKFKKGTDTAHEVKLESYLISAAWRAGVAYAGQPVLFEVRTSFVGNGAEVEIKGRSEAGRRLGEVSGVMRSNVFVRWFVIPEDMDVGDEIYFEVELPDNDLEGKSNRIPVLPAPVVSNLKWSAKEARRGDVLTLTADVGNVSNGTEITLVIYEYDADGAHDRVTRFPAIVKNEKVEAAWEYEYHEDTDEIPTGQELEPAGRDYSPPEYFFTVKIGRTEYGCGQESGLLAFHDSLEVGLVNRDGRAIADRDYEVRTADGTQHSGKTDEHGRIVIKDARPGPCEINLPQTQKNDQQNDSDDIQRLKENDV